MVNLVIPPFKQKIGIVIAIHNRYEYLRKFYDSLKASDLSKLDYLIVADDCSSEKKTIEFVPKFKLLGTDKLKVYLYRNAENIRIYGTLKKYLDGLLNIGCTVMGNIDPDCIMNRDWLSSLLDLKSKYPGNIYSAFNTLTKNRHKVLEVKEDHYIKQSIGGINMLYSNATYVEAIRPSLEEESRWDCFASKTARRFNKKLIVTKPSRIQHIGIASAMEHHDEPDIAMDFVQSR